MKRPLAFFGFTLITVLLCINSSESTVLLPSLSLVSGGLLFISLVNKKLRQSLVLPVISVAALTGCLLLLFFQTNYKNILTYTGDNASVEGIIAESPYFSRENERYYCVIKTESIGGENVKTGLRISFSETDDGIDPDSFQIGDKVSFTATVYPMGSQNSTYIYYYKSQKIYLGAYSLKSFNLTESKYRPLSFYIDALRDRINESFLHDFDNDVATLLIALLTGDKSLMEEGIYENFKRSGVVHIMAVSGMHLSIWVAFLAFFIDFSGRKGKIMAVLMILFTVFMMNFAFFTGSVKRAAMMTVLTFTGRLFDKKADSLNSLGFAAICVLTVNPFAVSDISFMLSFTSTLGIIVIALPVGEKIMKHLSGIGERIRKIIYPFVLCIVISISVSVFTMPLSLYYFGGISLLAPVTNLLFLFAVSPLIVLTGLYTFLRFVPLVSVAIAFIIRHLAVYLLTVAERISDISFSYLYADTEFLKCSLYCVFILLMVCLISRKYSRVAVRVTAILSVGIFITALIYNFYFSLNRCDITVFGDDGGNSVIVSHNGKAVLLGFEGDAYDEDVLKEEIISRSLEVVAVIFPDEIINSSDRNICHSLGTENILIYEGASVCLFDKVTVTKDETAVLVEADNIKTHIFYKDPLQEESIYDIINSNDILPFGDYKDSCAFGIGEKNPFAVIVRSDNIKVRGESSWLNLMKKVLKVT